jgi:hypothetical protein
MSLLVIKFIRLKLSESLINLLSPDPIETKINILGINPKKLEKK